MATQGLGQLEKPSFPEKTWTLRDELGRLTQLPQPGWMPFLWDPKFPVLPSHGSLPQMQIVHLCFHFPTQTMTFLHHHVPTA